MASEIFQKKQRIGFLQQSRTSNHWSAAKVAGDNFQMLNYDAGYSKPVPFTNIGSFNFADGSGSLTAKESELHINSGAGLSRLPFRGIVTKQFLAAHLIAFIQKVTEGALTPYTKNITVQNQVLDFPGNSGFLWTIAGDSYNNGSSVGDGFLLKNALLDKFKLSINNNAEGVDRLLKYEGEWVGIQMSLEQYLSGSWTSIPTILPFHTQSLKMQVDFSIGSLTATDICYKNVEISFDNSVRSDCITTIPNNYKLSPKIEITVDLPYTSETYTALKSYQSGDLGSFTLKNGAGTSDGELKLAFTKCILLEPPFEFKEGYVGLRCRMQVLEPSTGWSNEIIMSDAIDGGY